MSSPLTLKQALEADPNNYAAWANLGQLYNQVGEYRQGLHCYQRAYQLAPQHFEVVNGYGTALRMNGDFAGAVRAFIAADRLNPHSPNAILNLCALHNTRGLYGVGDCYLYEAQKRAPDFANAKWFEAMRLLRQMDYLSGWPLFEQRFELQGQKAQTIGHDCRRWQGEPGVPLVLLKEQGFGDCIQMLRFVPQLQAVAEVRAVEVPPLLQALAQHNLPQMNCLTEVTAALTDAVQVLPLLSIGPVLKLAASDIPGQPYWQAIPNDVATWKARLGERRPGVPRIAFYWAGNPKHANDAQRSLPLAAAVALTRSAEAEWIIVQQHVPAATQAQFGAQCRFIGDELKDFSDTAAVFSQVDLVIGVDSSPIHLAGAMGVESWMLLPMSPDWRWGLSSETTVWYDSLRLFRQRQYRDWNPVLASVVEALSKRFPGVKVSMPTRVAVQAHQTKPLTQAQTAHLQQARQLVAERRWDEAKLLLKTFFAQRDDVPLAFALLSRCLLQEDADAARREALYGLAWENNVECLLALEQAATAQKDFQAVLRAVSALAELLPEDDNVALRLGNTYYELGDYEKALCWYGKCSELNPNSAAPLTNKGFVLKAQGNFEEALLAYRQALVAKPDDADAHWNLALLLLLLGRYEEGLRESEWRWQKKNFPSKARGFAQPLWMGEQVEILLIHAEQGFGDCLQMLRYVPLAAQRVGKVVLEIQSELLRLMQVQCAEGDLFPANVTVVLQGKPPLPPFDAQVPMMTLPLSLGLFEMARPPLTGPHLRCKPGIEFTDAESPTRPLNIGFCWRGRPTFAHNHLRSFGLADMAPLFGVENTRWFSLQKTPGTDVAAELKAAGVNAMDVGCRAQDFLDTAAFLKSLDLFITTDTSVAHLAGALGVETWVAVMAIPDWRWAPGGEQCVWYDSVKLFRQQKTGDWAPVFADMQRRLREKCFRHAGA